MLVDRVRWTRWPLTPPQAEGVLQKAVVKGKSLVLVRWSGKLHAVAEHCPHHGASFMGGRIVNGCIVCPRHAYHYALENGRGRQHDGGNVAIFPVEERADGVYVGFSMLTLRLFGVDLW